MSAYCSGCPRTWSDWPRSGGPHLGYRGLTRPSPPATRPPLPATPYPQLATRNSLLERHRLLQPQHAPVLPELEPDLVVGPDVAEPEAAMQRDRGRIRQGDAGVRAVDRLGGQHVEQALVHPRADALPVHLRMDVDGHLHRGGVGRLLAEPAAAGVPDDLAVLLGDQQPERPALPEVLEPGQPVLQ